MGSAVLAFLLNSLGANEEIRLSIINYRQLGMLLARTKDIFLRLKKIVAWLLEDIENHLGLAKNYAKLFTFIFSSNFLTSSMV